MEGLESFCDTGLLTKEIAKMKCPGQDSRYWTGDAATEIPCPACGSLVEIFRDESAGRCRACGHKFPNPGANFGCAQWCSLAKECLGFAPVGQNRGDSEGAFAAHLIQWAQGQFPGRPAAFARVLRAFQHAKELILQEGGNPRIAVCGAILLAASNGGHDSLDVLCRHAEEVLAGVGIELDTLEQVARLVASCANGEELDTIEFRVVRDAETLSRLLAEPFEGGPEQWEAQLQANLRTDAAKDRARAIFSLKAW
jgi:hypothetical protein